VSRRDALWLVALVAAAIVVRLPGLGTGLWRDEGSTYFDATAPTLAATLREIRLAEINPPGYFLLMRAWLAIAGTSDVTMKLPSLLCGVALVPATYALGRCIASNAAALLAAAFAACATTAIDLSTDARPYALAALLAALATAAAFRALAPNDDAPHLATLAGYVVAAVALAYVQYTGLLLACGLAFGATIATLAFRPRLRLLPFLGANAIVAAAYLPWLPALAPGNHVAASWLQPIGAGQLPGRILEQLGYALPVDFMRAQYALALLVAFLVALALRRVRPEVAAGAVALLAALVVETLLLLREPRYVFVFTPLANVSIALALVALVRAGARSNPARALAALVAVTLLAGVPAQTRAYARRLGDPERSGMRAIVSTYRAYLGPGTLIVVAPDYLGPSLGYYLRAIPGATLTGVPHGDHPERFRCCEDAWRAPLLVADSERAIARRARGFARIAFVYDPDVTDRGDVPYSRVRELRDRLRLRYRLVAEGASRRDLEPVAIAIFLVPKQR
jgi:mannosyltransferase